MMDVLVGTGNPAKLDMFRELLEGYPVRLLSLRDVNVPGQPEETGRTPEVNALQKAAFYGRYMDYAIGNDAGLYLDAFDFDDPRQPGLHIRTPHGVRLDDEQMIEHYAALARSLGGRALAYYRDGFAVKTPDALVGYMTTREEARERAFYLIDTPSPKRRPGWPLDSISQLMDGTPFLERGVVLKPSIKLDMRRGWQGFLLRALGLSR